MLSVIMLSVFMLSVIMLSVVAPLTHPFEMGGLPEPLSEIEVHLAQTSLDCLAS